MRLDSELISEISALCGEHDLDLIVLFRTEYSAVVASRFGLYTQAEMIVDKPIFAHMLGVHLDSIDCEPVDRNVTVNDRIMYAVPEAQRPEKLKEMPAEEITKAVPVIEKAAVVLAYQLAAGLGIVSAETRGRFDAVIEERERRRGDPVLMF